MSLHQCIQVYLNAALPVFVSVLQSLANAVVMRSGMHVQEMMFGTLAMLVSRDSAIPLALVPKGYAVE
jgi:hypothetical protein